MAHAAYRPGKILNPGHTAGEKQMSNIIAAVEQATRENMTIAEIANALSISNARATNIRKMTPKARLKGSRRQ